MVKSLMHFGLPYGYWEAKDTQDDLFAEADKKFAAGYPSNNIVVQSPTHALLYQHGRLQLDLDITEPQKPCPRSPRFFLVSSGKHRSVAYCSR